MSRYLNIHDMSRHKSLFRDIIPRIPSAFNYILIGNDSILDPDIFCASLHYYLSNGFICIMSRHGDRKAIF